jgi:hypothetical protein
MYQATGEAINSEMITSTRKSLQSSIAMLVTLAPNTFRILISLAFRVAINNVRPNNPIHEINMVIAVLVFVNIAAR